MKRTTLRSQLNELYKQSDSIGYFTITDKWIYALSPAEGAMLAYLIDAESIAVHRLKEDSRYLSAQIGLFKVSVLDGLFHQ